MTEADLQKSINADLRKSGIKYYHVEASHKNKRCHRAGWPDLMVFKGDGDVFFVEIKNGKKPLRPEQKEFMTWCSETHYSYYVVSDILTWEMVKKLEGIA